MALNVHRNHKAYWGRGEKGEGGTEVGGRGGQRESIYLSLHCQPQNDTCIKMGGDESHFNVSVASDGQSHKAVCTNYNLWGFYGSVRWDELLIGSGGLPNSPLPPPPTPFPPQSIISHTVSVDVQHCERKRRRRKRLLPPVAFLGGNETTKARRKGEVATSWVTGCRECLTAHTPQCHPHPR